MKSSKQIKYERSPSASQLHILNIIYTFRFANRTLLSQYLQKPNNSSLYFKLEVLAKHEFLGKRYDKSYRLAGREAEYYVLPKGLRALRDSAHLGVTNSMVTANYRDKTASDAFVHEQLLLFAIRNQLVQAHPGLQYFTDRDVQLLDYFPRPLPRGFISLKQQDEDAKRFFVEYLPARTHTRKIVGRLQQYVKYYESEVWNITNTPSPAILYVCTDTMTERGLQRYIARTANNTEVELNIYTTTEKALLNLQPSHTTIWTGIDNTDDLLALSDT